MSNFMDTLYNLLVRWFIAMSSNVSSPGESFLAVELVWLPISKAGIVLNNDDLWRRFVYRAHIYDLVMQWDRALAAPQMRK